MGGAAAGPTEPAARKRNAPPVIGRGVGSSHTRGELTPHSAVPPLGDFPLRKMPLTEHPAPSFLVPPYGGILPQPYLMREPRGKGRRTDAGQWKRSDARTRSNAGAWAAYSRASAL